MPTRKLAAIMFTDMVGYTALMQEDEPKARELVQQHREMMVPLVEKHSGKVIQYVGDGTFSTFGSAIEAVICAIEILHNLLDNEEISLRIGIHVGDVVVAGEEVYGDGVNVASRIEPLAEQGGICISERVHDDIRNQPDIETVFLGEKTLKNVDHPIKVYCLAGEGLVVSDPFVEEPETPEAVPEVEVEEVGKKGRAIRVLPWAVGAVVVLILLFGQRWFRERETGGQAIAGGRSIAVMYFNNLSGDPSLDWTEAGMVEMLTANLGRFEDLDVLSSQRLYDVMRQVVGDNVPRIDRNTATQIAERAGVKTMLLGSVLGSGGQLRFSTQLVEVPTGKLIGAEMLDLDQESSIFSLVDSLSLLVAGYLGVLKKIEPVEINVAYTLTNSPEALRLYSKGVQSLFNSSFGMAVEHFETAVAADSTFAMAYYNLAIARSWAGMGGVRKAFEEARQYSYKVSERERQLIELNLLESVSERKNAYEEFLRRYPNEKYAWYRYGELGFHSYWPKSALEAHLKAIELDPYFRLAYIHPIDFYVLTHQRDKARSMLSRALSLDSLNKTFIWDKGLLELDEGRIEKAAENFTKVVRLAGQDSANIYVLLSKLTLAMLDNDFRKAEMINEVIKSVYSIFGLNSLAATAAVQGKYNDAGGYIDEALENAPNATFTLYEAGRLSLMRGNADAVYDYADRILNLYDNGSEPFPEAAVLGRHLLFLTALREDNLERAKSVVLELEKLVVGTDNEYDFLYYDAIGRLMCVTGQPEEAQRHFNRALDSATFTLWDVIIGYRYLILEGLTECLEQTENYQLILRYLDEFTRPFPWYSSASTNMSWSQVHLRKARAYQELGMTREAIKTYEEIIDIWKDADKSLPELVGAKEQLAALKKGS